jgi:dihydroorotase
MKTSKLSKRVILKGGRILDPTKETLESGDIYLENGKIKNIGKNLNYTESEIIDCDGLIITHGFCDIHAHFREPGREDKETLATGAQAALAGGFTRVCVMPNTDPPLDTPESIRFIVEKAQDLPVHIHPIGAVTKGLQGKEITEMGLMHKAGAVAFSDDGIPIANSKVMRLAQEYTRMIDVPVINHAEDPDLRNDGVVNESVVSTSLGLAGNPDIAESTMVQRDLEISNHVNSSAHIPHVSSAKTVTQIHAYKKFTENITAEVTPHHLFFNDDSLRNFNTNLKVAPPIRSEADRQALIAAVKDGTINCIATDHAPHTIEEKEATFDLAPFGMIGLETCFGAVNHVLCKEDSITLINLIKMLTINPRIVMKFDVDLFAHGKEAELTVFNPDEEWIFETSHIHSRSKNTPFVGQRLRGRVKFVISKGRFTDY